MSSEANLAGDLERFLKKLEELHKQSRALFGEGIGLLKRMRGLRAASSGSFPSFWRSENQLANAVLRLRYALKAIQFALAFLRTEKDA